MPKKSPPTETDADLNLSTMIPVFADEAKAVEFLEKRRWPNGPVCHHCGHNGAYRITSKPGAKRAVRVGMLKCKACRRPFHVRMGTVFEESKIPLRHWLAAIHLMTSSKKGISSRQIARELGITPKSAWFMTMRIREAMRDGQGGDKFSGPVEVDETYVGGKPRFPGQSKRGRGTKKTPVMVLVEREGRAKALPVDNVDAATLRREIFSQVSRESWILTDEFASYTGIGSAFAGGHASVNHSAKEYVRNEPSGLSVHTNTAESFFALLKRGHYGIFHQLSKRHLHRYCDEFGFRWNHRNVTDGERMVAAVRGAEGKRLVYK